MYVGSFEIASGATGTFSIPVAELPSGGYLRVLTHQGAATSQFSRTIAVPDAPVAEPLLERIVEAASATPSPAPTPKPSPTPTRSAEGDDDLVGGSGDGERESGDVAVAGGVADGPQVASVEGDRGDPGADA